MGKLRPTEGQRLTQSHTVREDTSVLAPVFPLSTFSPPVEQVEPDRALNAEPGLEHKNPEYWQHFSFLYLPQRENFQGHCKPHCL